MIAYGLPIAATLALWWVSTGVIFRLDSLDRRTFGRSMAWATIVLLLSLWLARQSSGQTTRGAAYLAFACGLIAWGWQLLSFYTGFVTGPRQSACPPDCRGVSRFVEAARTSLHHELSAALGALALLALTYGQPNRLALWTYILLWGMHQSAKLNVFFGVPNLGEDMLPDHLAYLASFMRRRPMNPVFPFSVTVSTIATTLLFERALRADATGFDIAANMMLAALMALAVAEHWFLVAPIDANAIWRSFQRRPGGDKGRGTAQRVEEALAETSAPAPTAPVADLEQPDFVERLSSGDLRRAKRRASARSRRGRGLRRAGERSGAHAHERELGFVRGRQRPSADGGLRAAAPARASDDCEGPSVRPRPAPGRARWVRRSCLTTWG